MSKMVAVQYMHLFVATYILIAFNKQAKTKFK